jgi:glycerol kinase
MTANSWLCQFLANITEIPVERPSNLETTALGAAFHAGLATGVWSGLDELKRTWSSADRFIPTMDSGLRDRLIAGWKDAVARTLSRT